MGKPKQDERMWKKIKPLNLLKEGSNEYRYLTEASMKKRRFRHKISPAAIKKAIKGSGGNLTEIARRLMVRRAAVHFAIKERFGEEWDKVRKVYEHEMESCVDTAQGTVNYLVKQRKDLGEAGKNARWVLEKLRRKNFGTDKTVVQIEGGDKPLQIQGALTGDDILKNLSNKTKRAVLKELEKAARLADKKGKQKAD